MNKKIIAIGLRTNQAKNIFSGQSMMFEAFIEYLQARDFDVKIIDLASKYDDINVGKIAYKRVAEYFGIILNAYSVFKKNKGSIVYITTAQTKGGFYRDYIFINFAKFFKCKLLLQQFGSNFQNFYTSLSPRFQKIVLETFNKGDYLIVEGEVTRQQFKILDNFDSKVLIVRNGLPEKNIQNGKDGKVYKKGDTFNMIYLSYMIESKGYWDVLHAVKILKNDYRLDIKCVFSGAFKASVDDALFSDINEAEKAFEKYIKEHKLESSIVYYKGLMGDKKAEEFKKSNVFLLPSYFKFEGQPVSVLEAMAYGSVPIVTNYRMIPEMVTNESGIFVNAKSPQEIADAIKTLIEDTDYYAKLSKASVDRYQKYYTLDNYCNNLLEITKRLA